MTMPPGVPGRPLAWMTVSDVFHIPRRGTVVTGQLQGGAPLNVGDALVCAGGRWQVAGIEKFRVVLTSAMPGSNIGVLLKNGPAGDVLRGLTVTFEPAGAGPRKRLWRR